jgi:tRNA G18 (ribose-2'-O)-methylase SpoU
MFERVLHADDPRLAEYRGVSEPSLLDSRQLFIVEGRLLVRRLVAEEDEHRWKIRSVLVSDAARRDLEPVLDSLSARVPVFTCAATDFLGITGHDIHRGCLALVERGAPLALDDALAPLARGALVIVLEGVSNADNIGGVFRNAAAFGADLVILSPACCSPLYRKAIRTSMGATLRVPFVHLDSGWPETLEILRTAGFFLVAMTPRLPSNALEDFAAGPGPSRLAVIVGGEGEGVTTAVESVADLRIRIPISPAVDSLNLAVACGIVLERLTRNGGARGILAAPKRVQT